MCVTNGLNSDFESDYMLIDADVFKLISIISTSHLGHAYHKEI